MRRSLSFLLLGLLPFGAWAGGHFDVDDAGTLDPGQCQYEVWGGRFGADAINDVHLGPACRVGPVELGLNFDAAWVPGQHEGFIGPQAKWTFLGQAPDARLSAAVEGSLVFDVTQGGHTGGQFLVPVSWHALEPLWVNFNLGADWAPVSGARSGRGGLQADWALNKDVSLIAERFRAFGVWSWRAGMRFNLTPLLSIDVSGLRTDGKGAYGWAIGINHEFRGP